jgi:hypothetical protein
MARTSEQADTTSKRGDPTVGMPECVGSDCRYLEFSVKAEGKTYVRKIDDHASANDPASAVMKAQYQKQAEALYPSGGKCGGDCICEKTDKVLHGPTKPRTVEQTIKLEGPVGADGFEVTGTITYTITVFEGVCGPALPKKKA